jgi:hypothetical protein
MKQAMKHGPWIATCLAVCAATVVTAQQPTPPDARRPASDQEMRFWLENMIQHHGYSLAEASQATGLDQAAIREAVDRWKLDREPPAQPQDAPLRMLPYPGGRHPRIGFLDGAVDPQRETKLSVFVPGTQRDYVVLDVPEALWSNLGLTYLAHTHIPTVWDKRAIRLPRQEWQRLGAGRFVMRRRLPNGIEFGTYAEALQDHIHLEMYLTNGSQQPLSDLRVQNCVMLKGAPQWNQQTNDNKRFERGFAAAHSPDGNRWVLSAWDPIHRTWGNPPCPCLHADPKFPDCPPGETKWLRGWLSFYNGANVNEEIDRIEATRWRTAPLRFPNPTGS